MDHYLSNWTKLHLDNKFYKSVTEANFAYDREELKSLQEINLLSKELKDNQPDFQPKRNRDILQSIYLATRVVYVISEGLLILNNKNHFKYRTANWRKELKEVIKEVDKEWDKGRYPDDPNKYKAKYFNQEHSHLLIILQKLNKASVDKIGA
jgi:hypothetical protein